jgi:hypothetical protein
MICIFDHGGGQRFEYKLKYPCDTFITQYASPEIDDTQLMVNWQSFSEWRCDRVTSLLPTLAAYTFVTDNSEQITYQLPYL